MRTYDNLLIEMTDATAVVSFNRPQAANALNTAMALELNHFFDALPTSCRAVILTGQGRHFCAGADLKERRGVDERQWQAQHRALEAAAQALLSSGAPVIAAVNGAAYGGGLEVALACDFIYAADTARFALTETTLGIIPGLGGTQSLPRAIGKALAKELIFSGRAFSAAEALQWGMVNRVCAGASLLGEAAACAAAIAANAPLAVRRARQAIDEGVALPFPDAWRCELTHYETLLSTRDRAEGVRAFNEKRKPVFTGD